MKTNPDDSTTGFDTKDYGHANGLTKREYFAAKALQALVSRDDGKHPETRVEQAVKYADVLITELNKTASNEVP